MKAKDLEFTGEGGTGVWQFAVFHVDFYDDGSPESRHTVILLPSGIDVDACWHVMEGDTPMPPPIPNYRRRKL